MFQPAVGSVVESRRTSRSRGAWGRWSRRTRCPGCTPWLRPLAAPHRASSAHAAFHPAAKCALLALAHKSTTSSSLALLIRLEYDWNVSLGALQVDPFLAQLMRSSRDSPVIHPPHLCIRSAIGNGSPPRAKPPSLRVSASNAAAHFLCGCNATAPPTPTPTHVGPRANSYL